MFHASRAARRRSIAVALIVASLAVGEARAAVPGPSTQASPTGEAPPRLRPQPTTLMPGVTGMPLIVAQVILLQRGLVAQVQSAPSSQAPGVVTAQTPSAGRPIEPGQAVRLWQSSGPRPAPPPRPAPQPTPLPPQPAPPTHIQPQPLQAQPIQPRPIQPRPLQPRPLQPQPIQPQPVPTAPISAPPPPSPQRPYWPPSQPTPSASTPLAPPTPQPVPSGNGNNLLNWLGLAALAALIAAIAGAALTLRARRRASAPAGAHAAFSVAASLAGGVKSTASDVRPSAAPTIGIGWTVQLEPPRIEGLGAQEPGA